MKESFINQLLTQHLLALLIIWLVPMAVCGQTVKINGTTIGTSTTIGNGTASLTLESDLYTLTLDGIDCTTNGNNGIEISGISNLSLNLKGSNSITCSGNSDYLFYSESATTVVFTSTATSASLTVATNPLSEVPLLNNSYVTLDYNNMFEYVENGDYDDIQPIEYGISLPLGETGVTVNALNKDNVLAGDELNDGKVSYDSANNTLSLNGVTFSGGGISYSGTEDLSIALSGTNTLSEECPISYTGVLEVGIPQLVFKKSSDCSLSISCSDGVIYGFSKFAVSDGLFCHTEAPYTYDDSFQNALSGSVMSSVTISSEPSYQLWLGGVQATEGTITGITYGTTATYNSINGTVSFNPEGNILTMSDGSSIGSTDSNYGPIISCLSNLTIKFEGNCGLSGYQNGSLNTGIPAVKSLVADAPLLFTSDDAENSQLQVDGSTLSDGCTVSTENQLIYELSDGFYYIRELKKPDMGLDGGLYITSNAENSSEGITLYYKIISADGTEGSEQTYSEEPIAITSPCTIKAYAKYQNQVSDTAIAKRYSYALKPIKAVYTGAAVDMTPTFSPSLKSTDGIMTDFMGDTKATVTEGQVTMSAIGTGIVSTQFTPMDLSEVTLLNTDTIQCQLLLLPPAPSVDLAAGEYLSSKTVTITKNDTDDKTSVWYQWGADGTATEYSAAIPVQEGTLYTWVKYYNADEAYQTLYSDTTTVAYTVKTDIAGYIVSNTSATYTGAAITPGLVVMASESAEVGLRAGTDYTLSYKQGTTTIASMTNAGSYTVVLTGTGNYGGTKEVDYTITQANLSDATVAAVADQTYTGSAIEPKPAVTLGTYTLVENTDFTFSYENNTNVPASGSNDVPRVFITGKGNFTGTNNKTFNITKAAGSISYATTDVNKSYGDAAFTNTLTIVGDGTVSYVSSDETVATVDASGQVTIVSVGTATITATAADGTNYTYATEAKTSTYTITVGKADMTPSVTIAGWTYGATASTPVVTGNTGEGTIAYTYKVKDAADDTYTADVPSAAGNYTIKATIAATTNYNSAEATADFTIAPKNGENLTIEDIGNQIYNGEAIKPEVTVKDGETTLTVDVDYQVTYSNNTEFGTATADITFIGNYTGSAQKTFMIVYQLDMKFATGQTWATYASTMTDMTVPTGLKAYVVTSVSGTTVNIEQINYIPAEAAVLLEKTSDAGTTFTALPYEGTTSEKTNLLQPVFETTPIENLDASNVYVLYNNEFRRATSGSIPANRGYLPINNASAPAGLRIYRGSSSTRINEVSADDQTEQWYSLDGRKLNGRPQREGVYIRNGKKIHISK